MEAEGGGGDEGKADRRKEKEGRQADRRRRRRRRMWVGVKKEEGERVKVNEWMNEWIDTKFWFYLKKAPTSWKKGREFKSYQGKICLPRNNGHLYGMKMYEF